MSTTNAARVCTKTNHVDSRTFQTEMLILSTNGAQPAASAEQCAPTPLCCSQRLVLATLAFFIFANLYMERANLSVVMVCMVNHTALAAIANVAQQSLRNVTHLNTTIHVDVCPQDNDGNVSTKC